MSKHSEINAIPFPAFIFGVAGLIPFIVLAVASYFKSGLIQSEIVFMLICYAGVILSFLGGVHWGAALGLPDHLNMKRMAISVVPSLVAWVALLMPENIAVIMLFTAFIFMLPIDMFAVKVRLFADWYLRLRVGLTIVVCLSLLLTLVSL